MEHPIAMTREVLEPHPPVGETRNQTDPTSAGSPTAGATPETDGVRRTRRSPLRIDLVIEEARKLLAESGLDSLSLRGLASRLGVTAPALYAHVDDKNDLMRRLGEDGYARLTQRFRALPGSGPLERIHAIAQAYVEFARENPHQFEVMFAFRPDIPGVIAGEELNHAGEAFSIAMGTVNDAIARGLIDAEDPIMTNITIWGAVHGMTTVILAAGCHFAPEMGTKLIRNIVDSILRGMSPAVIASVSAPA